MRESESTKNNPLVSLLGKCEKKGEEVQPIWMGLPAEIAGFAHDAGTSPARERRNIQAEQTEQTEQP